MKRALLAHIVACLLVATGCSVVTAASYRPVFGSGEAPCRPFTISSTADFAVGGIAAAAAVLVVAWARDTSGPDVGAAPVVFGLAGVVVIDGLSGLAGLYKHHTCSDDEEAFHRLERAAAEAAKHREEARKLTQEAGAAARAGDCSRVFDLAYQVEMLDKDIRDSVLARDVAVARCLGGGSASGQ